MPAGVRCAQGMTIEQDFAKRLPILAATDGVLLAGAADLDPVIVTLRRRPDRWEKVVRELAKVGIGRCQKFIAVDGASLSDDTLQSLLHSVSELSDSPTSHTQLTRPAIGCFLSHLQIWQGFLASDRDRLLVLEDDAVPSPNYSAAYAQRILSALPRDADLVLLGCTIMAGLAERTASAFLRRVYYFNGTYAYLITRKGCASLLKHLLPMRAHIDHQISGELVRHPQSLFAYAATPSLFDHDFSSWSDAYVPIAGGEEADRQLQALLTAAKRRLHDDGSLNRHGE
jgi:glycosyl transferase, family 25